MIRELEAPLAIIQPIVEHNVPVGVEFTPFLLHYEGNGIFFQLK